VTGAHAGFGGDVADVSKLRERLQRALTAGAGVVRDRSTLAEAATAIIQLAGELAATRSGEDPRSEGELANLVTVSGPLLRAATARRESRGAHARDDFPDADPRWRHRLLHLGARVAPLMGERFDGDGR
jgi:L-aspartate oxidase